MLISIFSSPGVLDDMQPMQPVDVFVEISIGFSGADEAIEPCWFIECPFVLFPYSSTSQAPSRFSLLSLFLPRGSSEETMKEAKMGPTAIIDITMIL